MKEIQRRKEEEERKRQEELAKQAAQAEAEAAKKAAYVNFHFKLMFPVFVHLMFKLYLYYLLLFL